MPWPAFPLIFNRAAARHAKGAFSDETSYQILTAAETDVDLISCCGRKSDNRMRRRRRQFAFYGCGEPGHPGYPGQPGQPGPPPGYPRLECGHIHRPAYSARQSPFRFSTVFVPCGGAQRHHLCGVHGWHTVCRGSQWDHQMGIRNRGPDRGISGHRQRWDDLCRIFGSPALCDKPGWVAQVGVSHEIDFVFFACDRRMGRFMWRGLILMGYLFVAIHRIRYSLVLYMR
jgi:hypothetical protein